MTFNKIDDPDQLDMTEILERKQQAKTNAQRQKEWRERQKALGRASRTMQMTEDEYFYCQRVLEEMRKTGGKPAAMRDAKGRFYHLDV